MKRIFFLMLIVFLIIITVNLSFSLFTLWSKKDVLTQTKMRLEKEQKENIQLQKSLKNASSPLFIEEQARDKLFLAKPGESLVLFPQATPSSLMRLNQTEKPTLQQWWELFF